MAGLQDSQHLVPRAAPCPTDKEEPLLSKDINIPSDIDIEVGAGTGLKMGMRQ